MTEIAIISGKGGTGKTSITAAFACIHKDMIVADCDVDAANMHLILTPENYIEEKFISGHRAVIDYSKCTNCGICIEYCRFEAISLINEQVTISDIACDGCKLCSRICDEKAINMIPSDESKWYAGNYRNGKIIHARLAPGEENSGKLVHLVREKAKEISEEMHWDTIIIDGPPGTGCPVISSISGVNKVVIVTEPSNSGFHDMKRAVELVSNFKIKTFVVINKYDLNLNITLEIENWCKEKGIALAGKIEFCEEIVSAMLVCKSIIEEYPDAKASKEIKQIFDLITNDNSK